MQKALQGTLSDVVITNHAKVDVTVTSKNYIVQNYAPLQDTAKFFPREHTAYRKY